MFEATFLLGLRTLIPDRALWNDGILQGQTRIPIFTGGSKLDGGTAAGVLCRDLGFELHFRLKDDCCMLQAEIFAILKAFETVVCRPTSESFMIFVYNQFALRELCPSGVNHGLFMRS